MVGKKKGAMVRQARRKAMEEMSVEVPLVIAIESIKLAKGSLCPFVAPREAAILQVDLVKLACLKGSPKTNDAAAFTFLLFLSLELRI
jgi:hypothetical protein